MSELLKLAERCEAATGPDRELDCQVHFAVTGFMPRAGGVGWPENALIVPAFPGWQYLPAYTASLDAAMQLVPEGMGYSVQNYLKDGCNATVGRVDSDARGNHLHHCEQARECKTPALALCAAALRARANGQQGNGNV